jgi:hypothetical protein
MVVRRLLLMCALLAAPRAASSQTVVDVGAGWAGFVDDAMIHHAVIGGGVRAPLTPRVSVGPEIVYMRGPGDDRDLFFTGNLTFDLLGGPPGTPPMVTPFLTAGAGVFRHRDRIGPHVVSSWEGAVTGGGGVRARLSPRIQAFVDARLGWELHLRFTGGIGVALRR